MSILSVSVPVLTQYTLSAGRENPLVTDYFIDDHSVVLRLIKIVIQDAGALPVSLCGELTGKIGQSTICCGSDCAR